MGGMTQSEGRLGDNSGRRLSHNGMEELEVTQSDTHTGRAPVHSRGLLSRSPRSIAGARALKMPAASAGALGTDRIICLKAIYI